LDEKRDLFSSPTQRKIDSTIRRTRDILIRSELTSRELDILQDIVQKSKIRGSNRTVIQKGGYTKKEADIEKRRQFLTRVTRNRIKNTYRKQGVIARKEGERKLAIQDLQYRNQSIPMELYNEIQDPGKLVTKEEIDNQVCNGSRRKE
jgi:hypothetical protein